MRFIRIMMKLILLVALGTVACVESLSQIHNTPGVVAVETLIHPSQEIFSLSELAEAIGLQSPFSLKVERTRAIPGGQHRQRLRLFYDGLPIRVFTLQATLDENGFYNGAVSGYRPTINSLDTSVRRKEKELQDALADFVNSVNTRVDLGDIKGKDIDNFDAVKQIRIDPVTGQAEIVYFASGLLQRENYLRNPRANLKASTLEVIDGSTKLRFFHGSRRAARNNCPSARGGNAKWAGLVYGPGSNEVCLNTQVKGVNCYLANDRLVVKSGDNSFDRKQAKVVKFKCDDGPNDSVNGANSPSADAFYYATRFFDLLQDWGQIDLSQREPQVIYTHVGLNYDNSFFDGYTVSFGDGSDILAPLTVPELIGHELGHALTRSFDNLQFEDESLAVDESFSDICGKALSAYVSGTGQVSNWGFANEAVKQANLALRYFDNPTADQFTIDNVNNFNGDIVPFQGVGILDKVFYCVVNQGFSVKSAFQAFVHANAIYWNEETGFIDGACGLYRAASDLALNTAAVASCASGVGIDLSFCSLAGTQH